ncbi:MAG: type VI secretion system contractile sheath large subunit [Agarilytica sp.]
MSRASISTGNIHLDTNKDSSANKDSSSSPNTPKKPAKFDDSRPMHIAIVGDFSGRASRGECDATSLTKRKAIEVDRDNFEEVFTRLQVSLSLPVNDTPLTFGEYDDLHPDFLVEKVALFEQFRTLKRRLNKPELFEQAVNEIRQWSTQKLSLQEQAEPQADPESSYDDAETPEGIPMPESMLDAVLAQSLQNTDAETNADLNTPFGSVDQLIKDIVAPYVEAKADPRLPEMEQAVDDACAQTLRKIMHASAFQELEANWRALYLLIRRLETNRNLKLFLFDISHEEMVDDLINCEEVEDSQLYRLFVDQTQIPGATPYSVLQFNVQIQDDIDDLCVASAMGDIAQASGGVAITGASETLAGCENIEEGEDVDDWNYHVDDAIYGTWKAIRASQSSAHLALVAPHFLLRLPYGNKTSPIESIPFEELDIEAPHNFYCWGNSATLITLLLGQAFSQSGWSFKAGQINEVEELPFHVYQVDGETIAKACAEIYMRDSVADRFAEAGILSARSVKGKTSVLIPRFRSASLSGNDLFEHETA